MKWLFLLHLQRNAYYSFLKNKNTGGGLWQRQEGLFQPHLTDKSRFEPVLPHLKTREFYLVYCLIG